MFFQNNILTQPAFFVGLIVFIGYILLKRPIYDAFAGCIKALVGYLILNVASSAAFQPGPLMATYYSTKSYVYNLKQFLYFTVSIIFLQIY
mgnify:CR=1 FL=1